MTDHDRTLGKLEGQMDAMHETVTDLCSKIDKMLEAHASCRTELKGAIDGHETRIGTIEATYKKAVIIGIALISSGAAGGELVKAIIKAVNQ